MCNPHDLHVLSFANGFTLWHYQTNDPMEELLDPTYFNTARTLLRRGDCLITAAGKDNSNHALLVITEIDEASIRVNGTMMHSLTNT